MKDNLLKVARDVIRIESAALQRLAELINSSFAEVVEAILSLRSEGRVVFLGMGKAGFIAQKISASLASIGTSSYYLHPAEAVHGDLGRFSEHDLVFVLSNSGETPEILRVLPHLKRIGCKVVALTATAQSSLGKHADFVIEFGEISEADPFGLAPTTSTTVMLAIGDALLAATISQKNFSREQFALFHPGGSLGRSLVLVSQIMRSGEELCIVTENMLSKEVLHRISATKGRPGAAVIVDETGQTSGIFTDGNLRRCLEQASNFLERPIKDVMTRAPKSIEADRLAHEALHMMKEHSIDQVLVIDSASRPIGMLDIQDLIDLQTS